MVNNIKLDNINVPASPGKIGQNPKQSVSVDKPDEGVTVTNHMGKLVSLLNSGDPVPEENSRVLDVKRQIQANDYKVDFNALAVKLLNSGVLRTSGA